MKNPFKDLLSKEGKKILSRYEKPTKKYLEHVDGIVGGIEYKMKDVREYGDPCRTTLANDTTRNETYEYIQYIRKTVATVDDIIQNIQERIVEITNGITTIEKSESISLLITDFEKEIIIKSMMRLINYLRVAQAKIDGARIMMYSYTESILQNIDKGSTYLSYTYDSDKKEWHMSIGYHTEEDNESNKVVSESETNNINGSEDPKESENTEFRETDSPKESSTEDPGFKATKDGIMFG